MDVTHLTEQTFPDKVEIQVHEADWADYQDVMEQFQHQQDWLLEELLEKQKAK
jgi:RNA:NAD 2'-phosphotransferase (TPT1/KptA family)